MEPSLPAPNTEGIKASGVAEQMSNYAEVAPNVAAEGTHESLNDSVAHRAATNLPAQTVAVPSQPITQSVPTVAQGGATTNPQIADDVDLIEKEWVDKAKNIVKLTKGDPHQQERQVSHLQADYLMKRYNKQIKVPE